MAAVSWGCGCVQREYSRRGRGDKETGRQGDRETPLWPGLRTGPLAPTEGLPNRRGDLRSGRVPRSGDRGTTEGRRDKTIAGRSEGESSLRPAVSLSLCPSVRASAPAAGAASG